MAAMFKKSPRDPVAEVAEVWKEEEVGKVARS